MTRFALVLALATSSLAVACISTDRTDTIRPVTQPNGLAVTLTPEGELGWQIVVRNDTPEQVDVVWDESTFVASDGTSLGRIVRGNYDQTRWSFHDLALPDGIAGSPQAPSPIAAGATMTDWVVPEAYLGGQGMPVGGRVTLVFRHGDAIERWTGDVESPVVAPTDADGWWCASANDGGAPARCARTEDECVGLARGACAPVDQAACAVQARPGAAPVASCYRTIDQCTAATSSSSAAATCALSD